MEAAGVVGQHPADLDELPAVDGGQRGVGARVGAVRHFEQAEGGGVEELAFVGGGAVRGEAPDDVDALVYAGDAVAGAGGLQVLDL